MREILFRGKRMDNGEWKYGYYATVVLNGKLHSAIDTVFNNRFVTPTTVYPETVGEYTGLTDKNGTRIFEGDIVTQKDSLDDRPCGRGAIKYGMFNCGCCHAVYGFYATNEDVDLRTLQSECDEGKEIEVIGNIYDNPELLEVEK